MLTERIETLLVGNATGLVNTFREGGTAADAFATQTTGRAGAAMERLGLQGLTTGDMIQKGLVVGAGVGAIAVGKMAFDGIQKFADLTGAVRGFQRITGASAEDASRLAAATARMGIDAGTAQSAFGQLTKRIGEHKDTLAQWGVEIARNKDGSVNFSETLGNISDKYRSLTDATQQQAFATENFGKGAQSINSLLGQGKDNLQAFYDIASRQHQVFSQDDLDKGLQYSRSLKDLQTAFQGIELELGGALLPLITTFAHALQFGVEALDAVGNAIGGVNLSAIALGAGIGALIAGPWGALAGGAIGLASALGIFGDSTDSTSRQVNDFADALERANGKLDETVTKSARSLLEQRHQLDDLGRSGVALADVLDGVNGSSRSNVTALRDMASATQDFIERTQGSKEAISEHNGALQGAGERLAEVRRIQGEYIDKVRETNPVLADELTKLSESNRLNSGLIGTLGDLAGSHVKVTQRLKDRTAAHATDNEVTDKSTGAITAETKATEEAARAIDQQRRALQGLTDAETARWDKGIAAEQATWAAKDAVDAYNSSLTDGTSSTEDQAKALLSAESAFTRAGAAAYDKAAADNAGKTPAEQHAAATYAQIGTLGQFRDTLAPDSPLRAFLDAYIARLADPNINGIHTATVTLDDQAMADLNALHLKLQEITGQPWQIVVQATNQFDNLGGFSTPDATISSNRDTKLDVTDLDNTARADIIAGIRDLDVTTWRYDHEQRTIRHIGPMAQDFADTFGLGSDRLSIAVVDYLGVLTVTVQHLLARIAELEEGQR